MGDVLSQLKVPLGYEAKPVAIRIQGRSPQDRIQIDPATFLYMLAVQGSVTLFLRGMSGWSSHDTPQFPLYGERHLAGVAVSKMIRDRPPLVTCMSQLQISQLAQMSEKGPLQELVTCSQKGGVQVNGQGYGRNAGKRLSQIFGYMQLVRDVLLQFKAPLGYQGISARVLIKHQDKLFQVDPSAELYMIASDGVVDLVFCHSCVAHYELYDQRNPTQAWTSWLCLSPWRSWGH